MHTLYRPLLYLHILLGLVYMLSHGASAAAAFRLRRETDLERVRALLDLSASPFVAMYVSLLVLVLGGVALGFVVRVWSAGWIWVSLGLLIAILLFMWIVASRHFHSVRKAAGLRTWKDRANVRRWTPFPWGSFDGCWHPAGRCS